LSIFVGHGVPSPEVQENQVEKHYN
jgi:hypothetical protein